MNKSLMVREVNKVLTMGDTKFKYDYKRNRFVLILKVRFIQGTDSYNAWSKKVLKRVHKLVKITEKFGIGYVGSNWNWVNFYEEQSVKLYFKPIKTEEDKRYE